MAPPYEEVEEVLPHGYEALEQAYWAEFLSTADSLVSLDFPSNPEYLDDTVVEKIRSRSLMIRNKVIEEEEHVAAEAGLASCKGAGKSYPVIYFSNRNNIYNSKYVYVFFREHEFAHFTLSHINCPHIRRKNRALELAADCQAARILRSYGETGDKIVLGVAATFQALEHLEKKPPSYYPSNQERADQLREGCF